jgi:hypothetical protein
MAVPVLDLIALSPDRLQRAVWVVVDPRDAFTGQRLSIPLRVSLKDVTATPFRAQSGVYCFVDLALPAAQHIVQVEPALGESGRYFGAEQPFNLDVVPVPATPLKRNPVSVALLPRPAYPFDAQTTLARGRLLTASDGTPLAGASIDLILDAVDLGLRGRTDERGEFVVGFPPPPPGDDPADTLETFTFQLRFVVGGHPPHVTALAAVTEGTALSLNDITFPGT